MTRRDRIVVLVLLAAGVMAAFWFLALTPKREEAAKLSQQIATQQTRLETAQASATKAKGAKARYDADYATVARLGQAVPAQDDVPSLVYQLDRAAAHSKIDFRSLTVTADGTTTPAPAPAPAAPAQGTTGPTGPSGAGPVDATQTAAASQPAGTAVGSAAFPTLPFAFGFDGSFFDMKSFLTRLDGFTRIQRRGVDVRGRLLTVDSVSLTASRDGFPKVSAKVSATAYVLPAGEGVTAGATPDGPAAIPASSSGTDSGSGTPSPTTAATAALTGGSR